MPPACQGQRDRSPETGVYVTPGVLHRTQKSPASASQVLGLKACATPPGQLHLMLQNLAERLLASARSMSGKGKLERWLPG